MEELTTKQKVMIALSHLSVLLGIGIILPIIFYFVIDDYEIKQNAKEAAGFQICIIIADAILGVLLAIGWGLSFILIGIPIVIVAGICLFVINVGAVVFAIIATIKSLKAGIYYYPVTSKIVNNVIK